jgi:hypothetical protein
LRYRFTSPPARLLVRTDAERQLGEQLVRQHCVDRMDATQPRIAEELLERAAPENAEAAGGRITRIGLFRVAG